jgi:hypothetical protein
MLAASATKGRLRRRGAHRCPGSSGAGHQRKCNDPIAGTKMLYAVLAKANSREEILANRIAVKRLGRMSDAPRASARL